MKKMLKVAAVLAAMAMAFTLGACDDGSSSGSGGGGGGSGGGSSYLKIEGNKVTAVYLSKLPSDGKIVIPDGVEELDSQWYWDKDAYYANSDDYLLPLDKVTSISLPVSLESFGSVIVYDWITDDQVLNNQPLDIDIIYRGTLADYCKKIGSKDYVHRYAKSIKVGDDDLKTLEALVIPDGVTEIAESAFSNLPNIKSVTIPKSVKEIGDSAFHSNNVTIEAVTYKGTLKDWCDINNDSSLLHAERITMSDGTDLKTLTEITADDIAGATKIGYCAFAYCNALTKVVIPESVTEIGQDAFYRCSELYTMDFEITDGWYEKSGDYEFDVSYAASQLTYIGGHKGIYRKTE